MVFANLLFARPIARLSAQLRHVERFSLDGVRYAPTFLSELNDFSLALKHMAGGLSAFAKYMPLDVVQPLISGGVEPRPGGHLREVTVMFADLPGFTELTETLGPGVEPHLTSFLTIAVAAVHAEGGTVDKFIGDAVMAIWNAPSAVPDHALRACRAAAAIRTAMHALPAISPDRDAIRVRIGINTGTALVGNVGSAERLSYTAIGDTVNLASRLVGIGQGALCRDRAQRNDARTDSGSSRHAPAGHRHGARQDDRRADPHPGDLRGRAMEEACRRWRSRCWSGSR